MTELPDNVAAALDSKNFDVLDFVSGQGAPIDKVVIYTDDEAGYELASWIDQEAANADLAEEQGLGIADEVEWLDPEVRDELVARIEASALTFKLKGLAPAAKKAIRAEQAAKHHFKEGSSPDDNEEFFEEFSYTLIAKTIASVTNAEGAVDDKSWTPERVAQLRARLNETEFSRLDTAVYDLNYKTDIFDRAASADFLSKR